MMKYLFYFLPAIMAPLYSWVYSDVHTMLYVSAPNIMPDEYLQHRDQTLVFYAQHPWIEVLNFTTSDLGRPSGIYCNNEAQKTYSVDLHRVWYQRGKHGDYLYTRYDTFTKIYSVSGKIFTNYRDALEYLSGP